MPSKSIHLPRQFLFRASYVVKAEDINFADHLAAVRVLPIAIHSHARLLENLGHDPEAATFGLIMASSQVDYIAEAYLDDVLDVDIAVNFVSDKSFDFVFRISDQETGLEVARAKTRMLSYDYLMKRVVETPSTFIESVETMSKQHAA